MKKMLNNFLKYILKNNEVSSSKAIVYSPKKFHMKFNLNDLITDSGRRISIKKYDVTIRNQVRREYFLKGLCNSIAMIFSEISNEIIFEVLKKYGI